jgi:hypothetical protein
MRPEADCCYWTRRTMGSKRVPWHVRCTREASVFLHIHLPGRSCYVPSWWCEDHHESAIERAYGGLVDGVNFVVLGARYDAP